MTNECLCSSDGDCAIPDYFRKEAVRARKEHICVECGDLIPPGSTYTRIICVSDGVWYRYSMCTTCTAISNDLCPSGHVIGCLGEIVSERLGVPLE